MSFQGTAQSWGKPQHLSSVVLTAAATARRRNQGSCHGAGEHEEHRFRQSTHLLDQQSKYAQTVPILRKKCTPRCSSPPFGEKKQHEQEKRKDGRKDRRKRSYLAKVIKKEICTCMLFQCERYHISALMPIASC